MNTLASIFRQVLPPFLYLILAIFKRFEENNRFLIFLLEQELLDESF